MFTFLLVVHAIIAAALVGVILMQRSEGGGLGMGGSPTGLMSARGAADFLTRATTILATIFVVLSITLAALATVQRAPRKIDDSLAVQPGTPTNAPLAPVPTSPAVDPLAAAAAAGSATGEPSAPAITARVEEPKAPAAQPKAPATEPRAAPPAPAASPKAAPAAPRASTPSPAAAPPAPVTIAPPAPKVETTPANGN